MSDKHYSTWIFGTFKAADKSVRAYSKWHVLYNVYYTYCGLEGVGGKVKTRAWTDGPPEGLVCTGCGRRFERSMGMTPTQVSEIAQKRHMPSENRMGVGMGYRPTLDGPPSNWEDEW
jgi:hypothetical protein